MEALGSGIRVIEIRYPRRRLIASAHKRQSGKSIIYLFVSSMFHHCPNLTHRGQMNRRK